MSPRGHRQLINLVLSLLQVCDRGWGELPLCPTSCITACVSAYRHRLLDTLACPCLMRSSSHYANLNIHPLCLCAAAVPPDAVLLACRRPRSTRLPSCEQDLISLISSMPVLPILCGGPHCPFIPTGYGRSLQMSIAASAGPSESFPVGISSSSAPHFLRVLPEACKSPSNDVCQDEDISAFFSREEGTDLDSS